MQYNYIVHVDITLSVRTTCTCTCTLHARCVRTIRIHCIVHEQAADDGREGAGRTWSRLGSCWMLYMSERWMKTTKSRAACCISAWMLKGSKSRACICCMNACNHNVVKLRVQNTQGTYTCSFMHHTTQNSIDMQIANISYLEFFTLHAKSDLDTGTYFVYTLSWVHRR